MKGLKVDKNEHRMKGDVYILGRSSSKEKATSRVSAVRKTTRSIIRNLETELQTYESSSDR